MKKHHQFVLERIYGRENGQVVTWQDIRDIFEEWGALLPESSNESRLVSYLNGNIGKFKFSNLSTQLSELKRKQLLEYLKKSGKKVAF